ncbi:MAG: hypothetical protein AB4372_18855 [Xenococcus sp. (in: cyanobacteria)]
MQILQAEQNKLSQVHLELHEYKKTFEEVLSIDTNEEYKKEVFRILDEINEKIDELNSIFPNDDQLILKITKKHKEVKKLFYEIVNLSREFKQDKIIELTLDNIKIKDINTEFIISDHLIKKIKQIGYNKKKNYKEIIQTVEKVIERIKHSEFKYLEIKEKKLIKKLDYYLDVIINLNCAILQAQNYFPKINKGFSSNNLKEKNRLNDYKNTLKNVVYNLISHIKEDNKDFIVTLKDIAWSEYENITETIGEASWCRISYLDGVLELMVTGERHENINRTNVQWSMLNA